MPTHAEQRVMGHSPAQMFDLVADVERYPEFLPWCTAARIRSREGDVMYADLVIGFKMVRERFTSRVALSPPDRIDVSYSEGPFKYLNNHWLFKEHPDGVLIDFYVDFEFRNRMLQRIMGALFDQAVRLMVHSFEQRAEQLYGPSAVPPAQG